MRRKVPVLALATLLLVAAGCGLFRQKQGPEAPRQPRTTVRVENQNFMDMTVYVLNGTQRIRMGTVPGLSKRTFTIPANLVFGVGSLRFLADPIGSSRTPVSNDIMVRVGDEVVLVIPSY